MTQPLPKKYETIVTDIAEITDPPFIALYEAVLDQPNCEYNPDIIIDPYSLEATLAHEPTDFHKRQARRVLEYTNREFKAYATAQAESPKLTASCGITLEPLRIPVGHYGYDYAIGLAETTSTVVNAIAHPKVQDAIGRVLDDPARAELFAKHTFQGRKHADNLRRGMNQLLAQSVVNTTGAIALLTGDRIANVGGTDAFMELEVNNLPSRMARVVGSHTVSTMVDYGRSFTPWLTSQANFSMSARSFLIASAEIPRDEAQSAANTLQEVLADPRTPISEAEYDTLVYMTGLGKRCPASANNGGISYATRALRHGFKWQ